jgi:hypothetical protein
MIRQSNIYVAGCCPIWCSILHRWSHNEQPALSTTRQLKIL